jgi:uncharacterized protein (DUF1501 family)
MRADLSRRQFLRSAGLAAIAGMLPAPMLQAGEWLRSVSTTRSLVLLELEGGNDGLNTVVPYADSVYTTKRPTLKLTVGNSDWRRKVLPFADLGGPAVAGTSGLHAGLEKLKDVWQAGDLAVVHGVGYRNPNRSHFRGIDIWNDGTTDEQAIPQRGWLGTMLTQDGGLNASAPINGIIFNRANNNPARAPELRILSMSKPQDFIDRADDMIDPTTAQLATTNPSLLHILQTQRIAKQAQATLDNGLLIRNSAGTSDKITFTTQFPNNDLGRQAKYVAQCLAAGIECPFYKLSIGGFDNHTEQYYKHADLLSQVADALRALHAACVEKGVWNNVLVMSYSEFGRRVEENDSQGTDHGTAAPHFMMGGGVNGGVYGTQPSLTDLDDRGDLKFAIDYRQLYATCGTWLGITPAAQALALPPLLTGGVADPAFTPVTGLLA